MRKYKFINPPKYKFTHNETSDVRIEDSGLDLSNYITKTFEVAAIITDKIVKQDHPWNPPATITTHTALLETGEKVLIPESVQIGDFVKYDPAMDWYDVLQNENNLKLID